MKKAAAQSYRQKVLHKVLQELKLGCEALRHNWEGKGGRGGEKEWEEGGNKWWW